jgi:drug/metabolite transporter (DMT)-like permease
MEDKEADELLLRQGFAVQEIQQLVRLHKEYVRRGRLDRPEETCYPVDDRQPERSDSPSQSVTQNKAPASTHRSLGLLLIVISATSFGVMPIFARFAYAAGADPLTVLSLRFGIAAGVMTALMLVQRRAFPHGWLLAKLLLLGAIGYAGVSLAYFLALTLASAGLVALLLYLYPVLVTILSVVLLREHLAPILMGALSLALVGTALTTGLIGGASALGIILGIVAALLYAIYILIGSRVVHQTGSIASSTIVVLGTATVYAGLVTIRGPVFPQTVVGWTAVVGIALVSTVLAFVTFFAGLKQVGPITASTLSTCEPVVTVLLATIVLGERMGPLQILGGLLILLAAMTLMRGETGQKPAKASPKPAHTEEEASLIGGAREETSGLPNAR